MRAARGGSIVTSVRPSIHPRRILFPVLCVALAAGCASVPRKPPPATPDAAALTIVAEIALQRGDCRTASETYARAALLASAPVAHRASEVALACEDLPAAWIAAQRWRDLAPRNRAAQAMYATVALKLYRIADARAAVKDFLNSPPPPPTRRPARGTSPAKGNTEDGNIADLTTLLLEESEAPEVFAALNGVIGTAGASPARLTLLGELALEAYDASSAERYALLAVRESPKDLQANRLLTRVYVVL